MFTRVVAYCVALFCLIQAAHAATRVALVVGNSAYRHANELDNPRNDANDIAAVFKKYGFEVVLGLDLDKAAFEAKIRQFAQALKGAEAGVFFYAGHGLQVAGQNFIVPIDATLADAESLDFEAIRLDIVQRIMEREARASVLFLDACRNNPFARTLARSLGTRSGDVGQGLAPVESGIGTLISYSTQPGNVALDGRGRNSPFAGALAKELARSNEDLSAILIGVRNEVMQETNNKQVPWEHSALRARFFVAPPGDAAQGLVKPLSKSAEEKAWAELNDSQNAGAIIAYRRKYGDKNPLLDQQARQRLAVIVGNVPPAVAVPLGTTMPIEEARTLIRDIFKHVRDDYPEPVSELALVSRAMAKLMDTFPGALDKTALEGRLARLTPADTEGASDLLADMFASVQRLYGQWREPAALMEDLLNPVLRGLDQATTYFSPMSYADLQATTNGAFAGVGIEIRMENGVAKVITPIEDSPASRVDIKPGDLIIDIDGQTAQGATLEQVVARLRGTAGTAVVLTIERAQAPDPIKITLTRELIKVVTVKGRLEDDVAYIKISRFTPQTRSVLLSTVASLKQSAGDRLKGYVLDVRSNQGGVLNAAVEIADDFLDAGMIYTSKGRKPVDNVTKTATTGDIAAGKPIMILANSGSASGTEILVAALQENKRATVIGTRTYGRGTVQTLVPLGARGGLRITTARFSTPNGRELETIGVAPDVVLEKDTSAAGSARDIQLDAALARLRSGVSK